MLNGSATETVLGCLVLLHAFFSNETVAVGLSRMLVSVDVLFSFQYFLARGPLMDQYCPHLKSSRLMFY